jgi:hypothetical protein
MKYYLYISSAKVEMLWPQKRKGLFARLSANMKVDLKFLGLSLERKDSNETLYSKLATVEKYILKNFEVGTIDKPQGYFAGTIPMYTQILNWKLFPQRKAYSVETGKRQLAYFAGKSLQRNIVLIGSPIHIIESSKEVNDVQLGSVLGPYFPSTIVRLLKEIETGQKDYPLRIAYRLMGQKLIQEQIIRDEISGYVRGVYDGLSGPQQNVEFLARRLFEGEDFLVGTPLYVALAD